MGNIEIRRHGEVAFILVDNGKNLKVRFSSMGGGIRDLIYKGEYMSAHPLDDDVYIGKTDYYGKIDGPIAGRLYKGYMRFNGKDYVIKPSKDDICLHSEGLCFAFRNFDYETREDEDKIEVVFRLFFPKIEDTYPADLDIRVIYTVSKKEDSVMMNLEIDPSEETSINTLNHTFFSLGDENILNTKLQIDIDEVATYKENLLINGRTKVDEVTSFMKKRRIGEKIFDPSIQNNALKGYDHCYYRNDDFSFKKVLTLENERTRLEVSSDYPAMQIYTMNYPHEGLRLSNGFLETKHGSIAIEPVEQQGDYRNHVFDKENPLRRHVLYSFTCLK